MNPRRFLFCRSVIALFACSAFAAAPPASSPWEAALKAREQRATMLRDEVKALDARIESRVDAILAGLRSIGDSKDSVTKVARMKRDTIDRLQRTLSYYQQKRASMQEELRRPTWNLTPDQKRAVIAKFDARIEKRVAQIVALQKSLPSEKDYERYRATGSNWAGTTYEVNEDFRQNQRLTTHTDAQRDETVAGLRTSLDRLDRQNRTLQAQLVAAANPAQHQALAAEIAKNDELIKTRRAQLAEVLSPTETPTRAIGSKEAVDLDKALKLAISDLQRDFNTLFARYTALIQEVSAMNTARANVAAAKAKTQ